MINAFQIKQYISQIQSSRVRDRAFNATFNNISVISWRQFQLTISLKLDLRTCCLFSIGCFVIATCNRQKIGSKCGDLILIRLISGGNRSTQRKPPTRRKSLTNFNHIKLYRVHVHLAISQIYSKTCINRTPLGVKNLFSLDSCLAQTGSKYIDLQQMGL